ncbi:hypothetical protein HYT33_03810 [Candidatus Roizmanbacteria bacterium]|nr:hypothetical protein [Candidatus Roizmanbacteria bacterium]
MNAHTKRIIILFIFFTLSLIFAKAADAASLKFDKTSVDVATGETFQIGVVVDGGSEQYVGVDANVLFDSTILEAQSVTPGTFFPTVLKDIGSQLIAIGGILNDLTTFKTGSGTVATITFKALKAGTVTLSFECQEGSEDESNVIKFNSNRTDLIVCSQNGSAQITVSGAAVPTSGPTATPTPTTGVGAAPTVAPTATPPSELPKTGILDNIVRIAIPGLLLVIIGGALKVFLKI